MQRYVVSMLAWTDTMAGGMSLLKLAGTALLVLRNFEVTSLHLACLLAENEELT